MEFIISGIVMIALGIRYFRYMQQRDKGLRKDRFERTNAHGVLEFANFEESRRFDSEEAKVSLLIGFGFFIGIGILIGIFLVIAGVVSLTM